ncbi:hypothetical protein ABPG75_006290 [Micractinium tetrahymenae]
MGVLEGLKRRLLGGSNRGARPDAAGEARRAHSAADTASAASAASPATAGARLPPAQCPPSLCTTSSSHLSPLAATLALPSPRRIPLGGLPSQLAALQQRFAELPPHTYQSPSRAVLAARLAAARQDASQAQVHARVSAKAAAGSPAAGSALKRSKRSKLAHLKQRQALRSADGSRPPTGAASPGQGSSSGLAVPESSYASSAGRLEVDTSEGSWTAAISRTQSEEAAAAAQPPALERAPAPVLQQGQQQSKAAGAAAAGGASQAQQQYYQAAYGGAAAYSQQPAPGTVLPQLGRH